MDRSDPTRSVGLFAAIALTVIAVLLLQFSKGSTLFQRGYHVLVQSSNVSGLQKGAIVAISGVVCGKVVGLELAQDGRSVLIRCWIARHYRVYDDAGFHIEQSGFLGDQYVSIVPGPNQGQPLVDGAIVVATEPFNLQQAARKAMGLMEKLDIAAARMNAAVARVDATLLSEETLGDAQETVSAIRRLSDRAEGMVARLESWVDRHEEGVTATLENVRQFSADARAVSGRLDGLLTTHEPALGRSLQSLEEAASEAARVVHDVRSLTGDLEAGRGPLGALLKDPELQGQMTGLVSNLNLVSSNLTRHGLLWRPPRANTRTNQSWLHRGRTPFR
jgi:ABC-type transporter Mla subunit MlaD